MIRCIAVDDEPLALELLEDNIKKIPFLELKGLYKNAFEAMEIISTGEIELVFLDVQMPGISGIQMIGSLSQAPMVIFITAYDHFALDGFNLNAIDYLVKPVAFERFLKAVNKSKEHQQLHRPADAVPAGDSAAPAVQESADYFFVNADYNLVRISMNEILFVEGLKDYIKIHSTAFPRPVITRLSMKNMEEKLPSNRFVRVHKSFIVAVDKIASIRKNRIKLGSEEIPISDFYKENLARITGEKHF